MAKSLSDIQPQEGNVENEPIIGMENENVIEPKKEKRIIKHTAKGLELFFGKYSKSKKLKMQTNQKTDGNKERAHAIT